MPKVSVIIPTFNRVAMVCKAIESILNQTFKDVEIIVIDDGSTDGTGEILRKCYGQLINYFYQTNRGQAAARNHGIFGSSGCYLLFLDSDDILLPQALEFETKYLDTHPDVDVVYTDGYFCDENGRDFAQIAPSRPSHSPNNILESLVINNVILACHSAMLRRSALETLAPSYFDEALRGVEDENLWIQLAAQGNTFAYLDVPTCKYCVHSTNNSRYDPSNPHYWKRRESVKLSRFKILNADFFGHLRIEARELFFYRMLLFQLKGDEPAREKVLNSSQFKELPPIVRARLLYYLGVNNIVTDNELMLGRERLKQAIYLVPENRKYRGILLISYVGRPLLRGVIATRQLLNKIGRKKIPSSPIGQDGLHSV